MNDYPIDTHCHLHFHQYDADRGNLIENTFARGMPWLINVCTELKDIVLVKELFHKDNRILPTIGVHPHYVSGLSETDWQKIREELFAKQSPFIAVGEVGLDLFRNLSPLDDQIKAFERFLDMASDKGLPVIVHSRDADEELLEVLDVFDSGRVKFVVHCFSGDKDFAKHILDRGGYISFTGNITYKKSDSIREAARYAPIERIMLETDAPYLAPQRIRGKRNEPLNVMDVAQALAKEKGISLEKLISQSNKTAEEFFVIG